MFNQRYDVCKNAFISIHAVGRARIKYIVKKTEMVIEYYYLIEGENMKIIKNITVTMLLFKFANLYMVYQNI